jgi:hypothetical protein
MATLTETPLQRVLREQGRKQIWLAERVGIDKRWMSFYTRGLVPPPETKEKIAAELGVTVDELWPQV